MDLERRPKDILDKLADLYKIQIIKITNLT